jgi:transcriptional regulator with XRE-family HTH domain
VIEARRQIAMDATGPSPQVRAMGAYIRQQRELARLSLRELARLSQVSNAYLSQIERGLHEPSVRVLNALADVFAVPVEDLMTQGRADHGRAREVDVEASIRSDRRLSPTQKEALIAVYRSYVAEGG